MSASAVCVALTAACVPAKTSSSASQAAPTAAAADPSTAGRGTTSDPSLAIGAFTIDGADRYELTTRNGVVTASAPATNTGTNTRTGFWPAGGEPTADQLSCATWTEAPPGLKQQGAVLRARTSQGRTTAITVTQNISYGVWWGFHIHVMDSGSAQPFHEIATFDLREVFAPGYPDVLVAPPYPWRMCARVVGDVVSFVVWPTTDPQPAWDDARYGGSVRLPAGWAAPGHVGWYVGHLEPGKWAGFAERSLMGLRPHRSPASQQDVLDELSKPAVPPVEPTWIAEAP